MEVPRFFGGGFHVARDCSVTVGRNGREEVEVNRVRRRSMGYLANMSVVPGIVGSRYSAVVGIRQFRDGRDVVHSGWRPGKIHPVPRRSPIRNGPRPVKKGWPRRKI